MINKPAPFTGLNISIPIVIPIKGKGFINHGSTLEFTDSGGTGIGILVNGCAGAHFKLRCGVACSE